ncbi:hypothetical protein N7508_007176 [Penicillium antarcticum]|uniref:uncharacterized protein n=1 Tax=Penicillium antarcticum TaxID=416450 RepID=UPI0023873D69|nr:uncharacterized protein N7508_007176 [Penicillium antarcticum]KAJ5302313.1 hypothetical protein N7508_007176 [Penicillium antarcticum]
MFPKDLQRALDERVALAASRGFTHEYQTEREREDNVICHKALAPATVNKYDKSVLNWALWRLSRNEAADANFSKDEPDPTPQILKSFAEDYVATRKNLPSQKTACLNLISFTSRWERETSRSLPREIKDDVLNFIRTDLTAKYNLPTKPRERSTVTAKDIEYLLRGLFGNDWHDYRHERARVQTGSALAMFSGSGARAGAVVESSAYRNTNECLYYRHITLNVKWSPQTGSLKRWVTIDPEFLKGWRCRDDTILNWFREHPVLGMNFVFWVIVHGIADGAFKGLSTVAEVLNVKPPKGRESYTLKWEESVRDTPFFRMVTPEGPKQNGALTFSSLRHNFTSLARRECFRDVLRVHGIRGGVANRIDPKASEATRGQALDHQNHDTYIKYQSSVKSLDIQALFYDLEPDYECRDMEQSMAHHRDPNAPQQLDAAAITAFRERDDIKRINENIASLTSRIAGKPRLHEQLAIERTQLYNKKAKLLLAWKKDFVQRWWDSAYEEYVSGNDFSERDKTPVFDIYKKYLPERARLRDFLFTKTTLDSNIGQQCLRDMVALCTSRERVVYYPNMLPEDGQCPVCSTSMFDIAMQGRAKHILQCKRRSLGGPQYQQRYRNEKRAHRRVKRNFVQFCYLCAEVVCDEDAWSNHCRSHLDNLQPRCGILTFRYTLVAPGFCPFCLGDKGKAPDERFQQWISKATLLNHIDKHFDSLDPLTAVFCPHPCCQKKEYQDLSHLRRHMFDSHSIEEPRSNCVKRKRKWQAEPVPLNDWDERHDIETISEDCLTPILADRKRMRVSECEATKTYQDDRAQRTMSNPEGCYGKPVLTDIDDIQTSDEDAFMEELIQLGDCQMLSLEAERILESL